MTRIPYGLDAPGLVRGFLLAGIGLVCAGAALSRWAGDAHGWRLLTGALLVLGIYALGMFSYMLYGSAIAKVRGRDSILDLIEWTGLEQVLDIGCGRGLMTVGAAHRLTSGHATGIDLWLARDQSSNVASATLENALREGVRSRVSVQTGDMRNLPFPDGAFDVVVSHWAVHNLELQQDRARALAEMARVVRPGGTILLTDIAHHAEYEVALAHLGLQQVRLVVDSRFRDTLNHLISFGSFRPGTLTARKG